MSIQQAIIATSSMGAGGGTPSKSASWNGIWYDPIQEGQEQHVQILFNNWDNSTAYWTVVNSAGGDLSSQVTPNSGTMNPGSGGVQDIYFTFNADATTDGPLNYYVYIGSGAGQQDYTFSGLYTVRDSSQTPALVLDLDPVNFDGNNTWFDTSGSGHNGGLYFATTSSNAGGTVIFNGTATSCEVTSLAQASTNYSSITSSIWFKPTAVSGSSQTLIAKELVHKLRINSDSTLNLNVSDTASGWNSGSSITTAPSLLTAGEWYNLTATVDANAVRLYLNGILIATGSGIVLAANTNPFDIGMWQTTGSPQDYFAGSIGEVKFYNYARTANDVITDFNNTAARYGLTPIPQSLNFAGSGQTYIDVTNNTTDWALGSTYTIEFWSNGGNASTGVIRTVASQGGSGGQVDIGFANQHLLFNNAEHTEIPEPTPGVWTHVAVVSDGIDTRAYYDGRLVGTMSLQTLSDSSSNLVIGRRGAGDYQYYYGKLANIKISNVARYTGEFAPSTVYTADANTKLILGTAFPTIDNSPSGHGTTVYNVGTDVAVPHALTGAYHGYSGGTFGDFYSVFGDPNIVAVSGVPVGARITSNIPGFGVRIVISSQAFAGGWDIAYDFTGLTGATSTSDIYNFYW
jgi:hypothetical protein